MSTASERINRIAERFNCRTYLEIGVECGHTFLNVAIKHRTGVDPHFGFHTERVSALPDTFLFEMESDSYFRSFENFCAELYGENITFDLIYIDGLHTFQQAMSDFSNSLHVSHPDTIWIFDDTVPCDPFSAIADHQKSRLYRKLFGVTGCPWHGDVFKCLFALHDFYRFHSYLTVIDEGNPQTVVWRTGYPSARKQVYGNMEKIDSLNYFDLLENIEIINPVLAKDLISGIGEKANCKRPGKDDILNKIIRKCNDR